MDVKGEWGQPIALSRGDRPSGFTAQTWNRSEPDHAGVYVFGCRVKKKVTPLYVGQSVRLMGRLEGYLKQIGPLVKKLSEQPEDATLVFIPCPIKIKRGKKFRPLKKHDPKTKAILDKVEIALIAHLAARYDLLNTALMNMDTIEFDASLGMKWSSPRIKSARR